jgi:acetylornithine deacetylase/succinyl-diaminopimelate desuccinylase-like protein
MPAVSGSPTDPILEHMAEALRLHDPLAIVVPYMAPGFTDANHYSRLGIRCFGFSPVKLPENFHFVDLMHGHDERIPVEGFQFGLRVLFDLVSNLCT